jgi:hypothetical protein
MKKTKNGYSTVTTKTMTLLAVLGLLILFGCDSNEADGYFLIVELENSENVNQYSVFNPYLHSLEECKSTANLAIAQILASNAVPKDSKVKSWRCSLTPPDRGG